VSFDHHINMLRCTTCRAMLYTFLHTYYKTEAILDVEIKIKQANKAK